jgi:hypothetical protein
MNTFLLKKGFIYGLAALVALQSCDGDDNKPDPPAPVPDQSFTQGFNNMAEAQAQGWVFKNLSDDPGTGWRVRANTIFYGDAPQEGANLLYANYLASVDPNAAGNLSVWAISPARIIQNGDKISFYALSNGTLDGFADRLQLRLNVLNTSDSIGTESTDVGFFVKPLLDINHTYSIDPSGGFPTSWTKFEATVVGLNKPDSGRFALRYFVELHGGANADELAVDNFQYISASHP